MGFAELIFVQRDAVQQFSLAFRGGGLVDSVSLANNAQLLQEFKRLGRHSLDFNIHKITF